MKCPNDNTTLLMTERHGIEIDYCPECRGVWLDRGELDKIIDSGAEADAPKREFEQPNYDQMPGHEQTYSGGHDYNRSGYDERDFGSNDSKKRRKESFLGELFDF